MPRNTDTSAATQWHIQQRIQRQIAYEQNPRTCKRCSKPLPFGSDKRQVYCSHSCAAVNNNAKGKYIKKPCLMCGSPVKNLFCSIKCKCDYIKQRDIARWLGGEIISESEDMPWIIRQYMLDESGNKCSSCGWCEINPTTGKIPLTIDHIDGNSRNHSKNNLMVLCPNCHSLTPTYGILNKGNGRKQRRTNTKNEAIV